jgi:hypothetical protein
MNVEIEPTARQSPRRLFYWATMLLLLLGVAATIQQKRREGAVAMAGALRAEKGEPATAEYRAIVDGSSADAGRWGGLGFMATAFGLVCWVMAIRRRESHRWVWVSVVVLLAFYLMLQLILV